MLGFPCNQFGGQDPGSNDEIQEFCMVNYGGTYERRARKVLLLIMRQSPSLCLARPKSMAQMLTHFGNG